MGLISDYFTKTVPSNARGLLNEVKRAPQDIRNLFSPEMAAMVQQAQAKPVDKYKAMGMAMDYLQTTTPTGGLLGMFIGKGAKTWDVLKAQQAEEMLTKGIDPREVWKQTGTMRGVDNALRQEIPDNTARMSGIDPTDEIISAYKEGGQEAMMARKEELADYTRPYQRTYTQDIDNVFSHNQLADAYPDLFHYGKYQYDYNNPVIGEGAYYANKPDAEYAYDMIKISPANERTATNTMLHELQHAIQQREGWARGGSEKPFLWESLSIKRDLEDQITALNEAMGKAVGTPKYAELMDQRSEIVRDLQKKGLDDPIGLREQAYKKYRNLAGEAEARLTQARMNLTPEERLMHYPYDMGQYGLDVPIDQLIVRGLLK